MVIYNLSGGVNKTLIYTKFGVDKFVKAIEIHGKKPYTCCNETALAVIWRKGSYLHLFFEVTKAMCS